MCQRNPVDATHSSSPTLALSNVSSTWRKNLTLLIDHNVQYACTVTILSFGEPDIIMLKNSRIFIK